MKYRAQFFLMKKYLFTILCGLPCYLCFGAASTNYPPAIATRIFVTNYVAQVAQLSSATASVLSVPATTNQFSDFTDSLALSTNLVASTTADSITNKVAGYYTVSYDTQFFCNSNSLITVFLRTNNVPIALLQSFVNTDTSNKYVNISKSAVLQLPVNSGITIGFSATNSVNITNVNTILTVKHVY